MRRHPRPRRRPLPVLCPLLAAVCALAVLAPAAGAAKPFTLGVQDDQVMLGVNPNMTRPDGIAAMKTIHARQVRINIGWARVLTSDPSSRTTPSKPAYDFTRYDEMIAALRAAGDTVQVTLTGPAPAWATHDHKLGVNRPDPVKFGRFAGAAAAHFGSKVYAISIFNEPNWPTFLTPFRTCKRTHGKRVCGDGRPALYRELYRRSYTAIKKARSRQRVWIGELAPQGKRTRGGLVIKPLLFLRQVLCVDTRVRRRTCGPLKTDGLAVHAYLLGKPPTAKPRYADDLSIRVLPRASTLLGRLERVKALRLPSGRAGIPIYVTEFGYLTVKGSRGTTLSRQAKWIPQAITMTRRMSRVRELLLYQLIDPYDLRDTWRSGLYKHSGAPKPVVARLARLRR